MLGVRGSESVCRLGDVSQCQAHVVTVKRMTRLMRKCSVTTTRPLVGCLSLKPILLSNCKNVCRLCAMSGGNACVFLDANSLGVYESSSHVSLVQPNLWAAHCWTVCRSLKDTTANG